MKLPVVAERYRIPFVTDQDGVRRYVIVVSKDQSRRRNHTPPFRCAVPLLELEAHRKTRALMTDMGLLRHIEFSIDYLVAIAVVRHAFEIC
jgi:hypothetical protein